MKGSDVFATSEECFTLKIVLIHTVGGEREVLPQLLC